MLSITESCLLLSIIILPMYLVGAFDWMPVAMNGWMSCPQWEPYILWSVVSQLNRVLCHVLRTQWFFFSPSFGLTGLDPLAKTQKNLHLQTNHPPLCHLKGVQKGSSGCFNQMAFSKIILAYSFCLGERKDCMLLVAQHFVHSSPFRCFLSSNYDTDLDFSLDVAISLCVDAVGLFFTVELKSSLQSSRLLLNS